MLKGQHQEVINNDLTEIDGQKYDETYLGRRSQLSLKLNGSPVNLSDFPLYSPCKKLGDLFFGN